jgi:group I intron endonuclease
VNGKVYIGQTTRSIKSRFTRHITDALSNTLDTHFARAIRKYGASNFIVEEIDSAQTQEELTLKEQKWIRYYDAVNVGYNETDAVYKCGGNTYKSKTDKEIKKIKDKIRVTKIGDKNPNHVEVLATDITTGESEVYGSMCECARKLGFPNHAGISKRCLGKTTTPYKKRWVFEYCNK